VVGIVALNLLTGAFNLVAGACGSFGILLDASDPLRPRRLDAKSDLNFSLWHTAVFSNDARKVVFTDEGGGGRFRTRESGQHFVTRSGESVWHAECPPGRRVDADARS
jgi:hypothetical protein